jgi:hypothetical protein
VIFTTATVRYGELGMKRFGFSVAPRWFSFFFLCLGRGTFHIYPSIKTPQYDCYKQLQGQPGFQGYVLC